MSRRNERIRNGMLGLTAFVALAVIVWQRSLGPHVRVEAVRRAEIVQTVVASGRVLAPARIAIASVMLGAVRAVHVVEGQRVRAGDVLVELDDNELRAQHARALASVESAIARRASLARLTSRVASSDLERAEAALAQARANLARYERMYANAAVSEADLENARTALAQAEALSVAARTAAAEQSPRGAEGRALAAAVELARADVAIVEARLAQTRIVAPADGIVLRRLVEPGTVAQPGAPLLEIAKVGETTIRIDPDESTLSLLREGLPALVSAEAFPEERFEARIASIAPAVDPERGTVDVRLRVDTPPSYLRADMTVSVEIEAARRENALVLSADAVHDLGSDRPWVLRVSGDRAERREVRLGLRGRDVIEIREGLEEEDRVVPTTELGVEPGMRVRIQQGSSEAEP